MTVDAAVARTHLRRIGSAPRPAGSAADAAAQQYAASVLTAAGYAVRAVPFTYSALPGRFGTPCFGAGGIATVVIATRLATAGHAGAAAMLLIAAAALLGAAGRWIAARGVLDLPLMRRRATNLIATRAVDSPAVWLVAHSDSKSQPVPQVLRAAGIAGLALTWVVTAAACAVHAAGMAYVPPTTWVVLAWLALGAGVPVVLSLAGTGSDGALDNASGMATVLLAATLIGETAPIGVLITSAEELGLAGARALARERLGQIALNCDGVDDVGMLTIMTSGRGTRAASALDLAARRQGVGVRTMRLIPGILVDAVAFADAGWDSATLSRGTVRTLARVHTTRDSLDRLAGGGIAPAAAVLADAAEGLATEGVR